MIVKILNAQFLLSIYNIPDYANIYKAYRIKETREKVQYDLVMCSLGPNNTDLIMRQFK
jgi:hypothetical protein